MTNKERHILDVLHTGEAATLTSVTGTVCPCLASNGGAYSLEWHRVNSTAAACSGKGVISSTTVTSNILIITAPAQFIGMAGIASKEKMSILGEIQDDDLLLMGAVTSAGVEVDLSSCDEKNDYITYNSNKYAIRHFFKTDYLTVGLLKRIS